MTTAGSPGLASRSRSGRSSLQATSERARLLVRIRAKWFYGEGLQPRVSDGYRTLVTTPYWQIVAACGPAPQLGT